MVAVKTLTVAALRSTWTAIERDVMLLQCELLTVSVSTLLSCRR